MNLRPVTKQSATSRATNPAVRIMGIAERPGHIAHAMDAQTTDVSLTSAYYFTQKIKVNRSPQSYEV